MRVGTGGTAVPGRTVADCRGRRAGRRRTERALDAPEAFQLVRDGAVVLIDVRSPEEWRETGLAEGAKPVTIHDRRGWRGFLEGVLAVVAGDRARPVALICATGVRSSRARRFLQAQGFADVRDVPEGMLGRNPLFGAQRPGWIARGLPLRPCAC